MGFDIIVIIVVFARFSGTATHYGDGLYATTSPLLPAPSFAIPRNQRIRRLLCAYFSSALDYISASASRLTLTPILGEHKSYTKCIWQWKLEGGGRNRLRSFNIIKRMTQFGIELPSYGNLPISDSESE